MITGKSNRTPIHAIPDDPESGISRVSVVAAKRAGQLQGGARSFRPGTAKKPTVAAMEEVRRGLVSYNDATQQAELIANEQKG